MPKLFPGAMKLFLTVKYAAASTAFEPRHLRRKSLATTRHYPIKRYGKFYVRQTVQDFQVSPMIRCNYISDDFRLQVHAVRSVFHRRSLLHVYRTVSCGGDNDAGTRAV
jgi:hypothetical protein